MRSIGSSAELERRRRLAMERRQNGYTQQQIADFLGVTVRTVQRWEANWKASGDQGLAAKPAAGRPRKLTAKQERKVLRWIRQSPTDHGFVGELWTSRRIAEMIRRHFNVTFNANYLWRWLKHRKITSQVPLKRASARNERRIRRWKKITLPRILKE